MASKPAVLVTRPEGQAAGLVSGLEEMGFAAYSQPMLELHAAGSPAETPRRLIQGLNHYQHIIFISTNAVHFGMGWIKQYWPTLPPQPLWHAIGEATSKRLQDQGVVMVHSAPGMNSESLLQEPALHAVAGHKVLIVKGEGGRVSLREELLSRGALVDELDCYVRGCPSIAPGTLAKRLAQWGIGLVMFSSGEGLRNMLSLLSPAESSKLKAVPLVVPSARVAKLAKDMGFSEIQKADNASDAAMLKAIGHWWQTKSKALEKNE